MSRAALDYLELAKVRHALELMHSERMSAGRILDATRERADTGRELPIEVIRAQLTTAQIEQRIAQIEDRDDSLTGELRDLMGLTPDEVIEVSTEEIPGAAAEASKDVVSEAMSNNVELKQAQTVSCARVNSSSRARRCRHWPSFALTGQYNVLSKINNYLDFFGRFQRNNLIFGVQVQIPIFASRTTSAVAFARADFNAANLALQKKRNELTLDVRRKARLVREAELGGEVARLELQLAQENVRVLQAQFDQGRGGHEKPGGRAHPRKRQVAGLYGCQLFAATGAAGTSAYHGPVGSGAAVARGHVQLPLRRSGVYSRQLSSIEMGFCP